MGIMGEEVVLSWQKSERSRDFPGEEVVLGAKDGCISDREVSTGKGPEFRGHRCLRSRWIVRVWGRM